MRGAVAGAAPGRRAVPRFGLTAVSTLRIVPVDSPARRRQFVELPYRLYAGDPYFVPQLRRDEHRRFDPRHNAFLEHADMTLWLALDGDAVVGRVAAIDDRLHNERHREAVTWFGFFEGVSLSLIHI